MRKTRDNFRDLWLEWGSKLWKELFDERKAIEYNENGMLKKPNEWSKEEKSNTNSGWGMPRPKLSDPSNYEDCTQDAL